MSGGFMEDGSFGHSEGEWGGRYKLPYDPKGSDLLHLTIDALKATTSRCAFCHDSFEGTADEALAWSQKHRLEHK
jgi:hypothetical protein